MKSKFFAGLIMACTFCVLPFKNAESKETPAANSGEERIMDLILNIPDIFEKKLLRIEESVEMDEKAKKLNEAFFKEIKMPFTPESFNHKYWMFFESPAKLYFSEDSVDAEGNPYQWNLYADGEYVYIKAEGAELLRIYDVNGTDETSMPKRGISLLENFNVLKKYKGKLSNFSALEQSEGKIMISFDCENYKYIADFDKKQMRPAGFKEYALEEGKEAKLSSEYSFEYSSPSSVKMVRTDYPDGDEGGTTITTVTVSIKDKDASVVFEPMDFGYAIVYDYRFSPMIRYPALDELPEVDFLKKLNTNPDDFLRYRREIQAFKELISE